MILFQKDWADYPTAIPDTSTKNESFIRFAALLKSMGVKNYYFCLSLLNPKLQGIDPHDPYLTLEQKAAIAVEVKYNFWYFIREVVRLPRDGGGFNIFKANRGNIGFFWSAINCVDFALIMPRQTGKSVGADVFKIWLVNFYYQSADLFLLTKDTGLRAKNIKKIKDIQKLLPPWLNPTSKKDADNTETITCIRLNNKLSTGVGQQQEDLARKMGRGFSLLWTQTDEAAFIPNVHISVPAMLAAGTAVRNDAKATGIIYGNLFTTTAGKMDTDEGEFVYNLINDGMYWTETLYDCYNKTELHSLVKLQSKGLGAVINGTFSHRQLGLSDQWLKDAIAESKENEEDASRDFLNKWSSGSSKNPLSLALLEAINLSEMEPLYTQVTSELYVINWYISEDSIDRRMQEGHYVIGLDSGNAVGKDANALIIIDIRDLSVIASCRVTEANLLRYSIWLSNLLIRYNNTTLIIENKSSGQSILDTVSVMLIKHGINPFKRIYNMVVDNHTTRETEYKLISGKEGYKEETYLQLKGLFGFNTNGSRRAFLYDTVFQEAASSTGHLVRDRTLANEIMGLKEKNGRVDHGSGKHDDLVIAWLLIHWFIRYSKNLSYYGIDLRDCLSLVSNDGATMSPEKLEEKRKLAVLNIEINELKDKLISAPNIIESKKYEKLLEWKVFEANKLGEITYSIDSILEDVKNNRVSKKSLRDALSAYQNKKRFFK